MLPIDVCNANLMINLLELPPEPLEKVFTSLIVDHGLKQAVKAQTVCKLFQKEVLHAIWTTRALENHEVSGTVRYMSKTILASYLQSRTLVDRGRQHPMTVAIYETLECIQQHQPEFCVDASAVQSAISVYLDQNKQDVWMHTEVLGRWKHYSWYLDANETKYAAAENALPLCTNLGLISVMRKLIEEGTEDVESVFGHPFFSLARSDHPALLSEYLSTKLEVALNQDPAKRIVWRRNISDAIYQTAIRLAIQTSTLEVLDLILEAVRADAMVDSVSKGLLGRWSSCQVAAPSEVTIEDHILILSVCCNRYDIAKVFLDKGANAKASLDSATLLDLAASRGNIQIVTLLLERGADISLCTRETVAGYPRGYLPEFSRSSPGEWGPHPQHPLVLAKSQMRFDVLALLLRNGITFEPGSELDKCLSVDADAETEEVLENFRKTLATSRARMMDGYCRLFG